MLTISIKINIWYVCKIISISFRKLYRNINIYNRNCGFPEVNTISWLFLTIFITIDNTEPSFKNLNNLEISWSKKFCNTVNQTLLVSKSEVRCINWQLSITEWTKILILIFRQSLLYHLWKLPLKIKEVADASYCVITPLLAIRTSEFISEHKLIIYFRRKLYSQEIFAKML